MTDTGTTWDRDGEHLNLLAIGYYVKAGLWALGCFGGAAYVALSVFLGVLLHSIPESRNPPPEAVATLISGLFGVVGVIWIVVSLALAALCVLAGRGLQQGRRRTLIYIAAALNLLSVPVGTVLGVFTLIVLARPSVAERFEQADRYRAA